MRRKRGSCEEEVVGKRAKIGLSEEQQKGLLKACLYTTRSKGNRYAEPKVAH